MSTVPSPTPRWPAFVRLELMMCALEMLGIALGLGLMLTAEPDEYLGIVILCICSLSFTVRRRRYENA
jgi:hypothetical protein